MTAGGRTLGDFLELALDRLRDAGLEQPRNEVRALLQARLGQSLALADRAAPLSAQAWQGLSAALERRAAGEPLSRILGEREFWSLPFRLSPATLDPRPDSETLVEAVLQALPDRGRPWRLLDLGTGSGCLLLALLSELPLAWGLGLDRAPDAAAQARANARHLGLAGRAAFVAGDWGACLAGRFEVVLSNPPYIESGLLASLAAEVRRFDPPLALDGGPDGLAAYRALLPSAARLLAPGGLLALEVGAGQAPAVAALAGASGFTGMATRDDLAGIARVVLARAAG